LQKEISRLGHPIMSQTLSRAAKGFGVCEDKLSFSCATSSVRVRMLRQIQVECVVAHRKGDEQASSELIARAYAQLRLVWERAVEEVLFRGVVERFNEGISTLKLREVEVMDQDYELIEAGMAKCSRFAAHDGAATANVATPHPDELAADIETFDNWRKGVESRVEAVRKRRAK
jgi:hypothetical protein